MLNILDPSQTVKFNTPIYTMEELVRTGMVSDGSCFLHAMLYATSSKYRNSSDSKKMSIIEDFRHTLAESLTKDQWLSLNDGELAKLTYSVEFRKQLDELYNFDEENDINKFILTVLTKDDISKLFESSLKYKDIYYGSTKLNIGIVNLFSNKLKHIKKFQNKISTLSENVRNLFDDLIQSSINNALQEYKDIIRNPSKWLGEEHIELLSNIFNYNIYFFNGNTREPYSLGKNIKYPFDKSIVLLWVQESHFEVIGKIQDRKIVRLFNNNDDFIEAIKYFFK